MAHKAFRIYSKLPVFTNPTMLPPENMTVYVEQVKSILSYCKVIFMPKMKPWCAYVEELERMKEMKVKLKAPCNLTAILNNSSSKSLDDLPAQCHDIHFCHTESTSSLVHILSILTIVIVILALLSQTLLFPAIMKLSKKTAYPLYMMMGGIFGMAHLIIGSSAIISPGLRGNYTEQLDYYRYKIAFISLYLVPASEICLSLFVWMICLMVMDHYWYTADQANYKVTKMRNFRRLIPHGVRIIFLLVLFFSYGVVKVLRQEYKPDVQEDKDSAGRVIRSNRIFKNLRNHHYDLICDWFRITLELVTPCVLLAVFSVLIHAHDKWNKEYEESADCEKEAANYTQQYSQSSEPSHENRLTRIIVINSIVVCVTMGFKLFIYLGTKATIARFPDIAALLTTVDFSISAVSLLVISMLCMILDRRVRRYILHGWLCSNTPPPHPINDLPYSKCKNSPSLKSTRVI